MASDMEDWAKALWMRDSSEINWKPHPHFYPASENHSFNEYGEEMIEKEVFRAYTRHAGYSASLVNKYPKSIPRKPGVWFYPYPDGNRNSVEIAYDGMIYGTPGKRMSIGLEDTFKNP